MRGSAAVRRFYDANAAHEAQRLDENVYRRLERDMTLGAIERHLPVGSTLLDVGGGPGAYLEPLARRGYHPSLCDLSPANVARAKVRARALGLTPLRRRVRRADAVDLSAYARGSFDGALVAGPFYHLSDPGAQRALGQIARVLRPGGVMVCNLLPRLHPLRYLLREASDESWRVLERLDWKRLLAGGRYRNPVDDPLFFTDAHLWRVDEFLQRLRRRGWRILDVLSVESFTAFLDVPLEAWITSEARYQRLLSLVERTAREPDQLGSAEHVLVVARRRGKVGV